MKPKKLLAKLRGGSHQNISFADTITLVRQLGFERLRDTDGSHQIFGYPGMKEQLNLQNFHGQAKAYQLKQLMDLVDQYGLDLSEEPEA